ncbi:MAG: peptidoglycan-binding protein [Gemmatimonadota bacterium]|nr:peptidoglycan-binding protein [Gemmatimonadota bacterium]
MITILVALSAALPAAAQEVEIISGAVRKTAVDPGAPGVRVVAFVQLEPARTEHRVLDPLLPEEVFFVQTALVQAGYEPGRPDGNWGPATENALRAFQEDRRLEPCGCVDYSTIGALGLRPRVVQTVVGTPEDESEAEVVLGPGRLPMPPEPEEIEAPPETVTVIHEVGNWWSYPTFFPGFRPLPPGGSASGGVPIGPVIRLGAPRGGPPPR